MALQRALMANYWTLAGGDNPRVEAHVSPIDFRRRVEAAAKAGFVGMSLWHTDLEHLLDNWTPADLKQILDDNGIVHTEIEFLLDWFKSGEERRRSDETRRMMLSTAEALGSHHIKVGDLSGARPPMAALAEAFAEVCRNAAEHGTRVGYEMMPVAAINTPAKAVELADMAGEPNGGVVIDLFHVVRGHIPFADVAAIPPERLLGIELNDGPAESDLDFVLEATDHRLLCGEGEWDVKGFVETMLKAGYPGPWGVEILSSTHRVLPVDEMAQRAFDTAIAQFPAEG